MHKLMALFLCLFYVLPGAAQENPQREYNRLKRVYQVYHREGRKTTGRTAWLALNPKQRQDVVMFQWVEAYLKESPLGGYSLLKNAPPELTAELGFLEGDLTAFTSRAEKLYKTVVALRQARTQARELAEAVKQAKAQSAPSADQSAPPADEPAPPANQLATTSSTPEELPVAFLSDQVWDQLKTTNSKRVYLLAQLYQMILLGIHPMRLVLANQPLTEEERSLLPFNPRLIPDRADNAFRKGFKASMSRLGMKKGVYNDALKSGDIKPADCRELLEGKSAG
jgi:hypothetical protein